MKKIVKKLFAICLSWMMIFTLFASGKVVEAANNLEIDGITYSFTFNDDGTATLTDINNPETPTTVTVPETVTYNGSEYTVTALKWSFPYSSSDKRNNVTEIHLPNTLKTANVSFSKFPRITSITIPGSITEFTGDFQNCSSLTSVTFEEGVQVLNGGMMFANSAVTKINLPSTLQQIGEGAFGDAAYLETIDIPDSITSIDGSGTFMGCASLKSVTLPSSVTEIFFEMFRDCTSLESVNAKGTITSIGGSAFSECTSLKEIPDLSHVTTMGTYAFDNCTSLACEVDLSALTEVPAHAFSYARVHVTAINESLTSIADWAFIGCTLLPNDGSNQLTLPDTLTSIGNYVFFASNLPETVFIPTSVEKVGTGVFDSASGIKNIKIDNCEDDVEWANVLPANVTVTYLVESISIEDEGDTISKDSQITLQEAVNNAKEGEIITIEKNVTLSSSLKIPAGKNITIQANNEKDNNVIIGKENANLKNLIQVEKGASVTFAGNLKIYGNKNKNANIIQESTILNKGTITLTENAKIQNSKYISVSSSVIDTRGENAQFMMTGGSIEGNWINGSQSGVVRISDGAKVSIKGGTIQNNRVLGVDNATSSAGILLYGNASGQMSGGTIANNAAIRGSAMTLYNLNEDVRTQFVISGGTITNNICKKNGNDTASGAIYVYGCSDLTMTGGTISKNTGESGGAVTVLDPGVLTGSGDDVFKTAFTMNGGTISNNAAITGGGVYSFSNYVNLNSGEIIDNSASYMGGGVYSEGNDKNYSTLHVKNAIISENSATDQGGGLWFCATGDGKVYVNNGAAIYKNTASGAGDDVVGAKSFFDNSITLANRVLGGGKVQWYNDGAVYMGVASAINFLPTTNEDVPRYDVSTSSSRIVNNETDNLAVKSVVDDSSIELAKSKANLTISGNTATYGGGIGANGGVIIGTDEESLKEIKVTKKWEDNANIENIRPESVIVNLMVKTDKGVFKIDSIVLSEENNWCGVFENLPSMYDYETEYIVEEEQIERYKATIEWDESSVTITNTLQPKEDPKDNDKPDKETEKVKTGDITNYAIYAALLSLSLLGLICLKKKKQYKK